MKSAKAMTLEDLALALGMSRASVSRAFTGKGRIAPQTREKVLRAARELGYQPNPHAQRLAGGRALNTVALFSLGLDYGVTTERKAASACATCSPAPLYANGRISTLVSSATGTVKITPTP